MAGKTYHTSDAMYWHEVVYDLYFEESLVEMDEFIINNQRKLLPRVKALIDVTPGGNFNTAHRVEIFASHKPFPITFFKLNVQVPGLLQWQVRNDTGSRTCLHPYMEFSDNVTSGPILPNCGAVRKSHQSGLPKIFPATSHTAPVEHVVHEGVEQVNGMWFCERRWALVPKGMKKLKGVSA